MRWKSGWVAGLAVIAILLGAASQGKKPASVSPPTYYKDVLPILQDRCQSCHRPGEIAPMPFVTYEQTLPWANKIANAVEMKMMPPWFADPRYGHFANDPSLSAQQIATIRAWVATGAAPGDVRAAPPPRKWTHGWNIPEPLLVVIMPVPVEIPADGELDYTYEIVPTHFSEDRWVQMSEVRPSSAEHVHHGVVYIRPPDSQWLRHAPVGKPFTASTLKDPFERQQAHETTSDLLLV